MVVHLGEGCFADTRVPEEDGAFSCHFSFFLVLKIMRTCTLQRRIWRDEKKNICLIVQQENFFSQGNFFLFDSR